MDETYLEVRGQWVYLYRGFDKAGQTVDFPLSRNRDVNAAKAFPRRAMKHTRGPRKITLDAYAASHRAVREMKEAGELPRRVHVRSSQYLNNLGGIEWAEKIKKGQCKTGQPGGRKATMPELWHTALAA